MGAQLNHEAEFLRFLPWDRRQRYSALRSQKARSVFFNRLAGYHFKSEFCQRVSDSQQGAEAIERILKARRAPDDCFVISANPNIDRHHLSLREALTTVVGKGLGTVVSCVPGKLAYCEAAARDQRYVLARPEVVTQCHVRAIREPDSPLWSFSFVNDDKTPFESADLAAVTYDWAGSYVYGESPAVSLTDVQSGEPALIWREHGPSEKGTDLWIRVTHLGLESWLLFEFPPLGCEEGDTLTRGGHRVDGPPEE